MESSEIGLGKRISSGIMILSFMFLGCSDGSKQRAETEKKQKILGVLLGGMKPSSSIAVPPAEKRGVPIVMSEIYKDISILSESVTAGVDAGLRNPYELFFGCDFYKGVGTRVSGTIVTACPSDLQSGGAKDTQASQNTDDWMKKILEDAYKKYVEPQISNTVEHLFQQANTFIENVFKTEQAVNAIASGLSQIGSAISGMLATPFAGAAIGVVAVAIFANLIFGNDNDKDARIQEELEKISKQLEVIEKKLIEIYDLLTVMQDQNFLIHVQASLNKITGIKAAFQEKMMAKDYQGAKQIAKKYADDSSVFFESISNILFYGTERVSSAVNNGSLPNYQVSSFHLEEYRHVGYSYYSCWLVATCSTPVYAWVPSGFFYLPNRNALPVISFIDFSKIESIMLTLLKIQENAYSSAEEREKLKNLQLETIKTFKEKILPIKLVFEKSFKEKVLFEMYKIPVTQTGGNTRLVGSLSELEKEIRSYYDPCLQYDTELVSFLIYLTGLERAWKKVQ